MNLATAHEDSLAMLCDILLLRPYFKRCRTAIRTDLVALIKLLKIPCASKQMARWRLRLLDYKFDIVCSSDIKHQAVCAI